MADESAEDKTEEASEKRIQDAREKGTVSKSTEINSVVVLIAGIVLLRIFGPWIFEELKKSFIELFMATSNTDMSLQRLMQITTESIVLFFKALLPVAGGIMLLGIVANVGQIGFLLTFKPIMPDYNKIDPIKGFKRLFSMRSIVEAVKSILKIVIIGWVAYLTVKEEFESMLLLNGASVPIIFDFMLALGFKIVVRVALVLIVIAILDYAYQRFEYNKQLKMTKQEVKEERKQMEGDPHIKGRIRALQREMARRRMMDEVPKATVVVTNPTHIAIALKYDPEAGDAPIVVAKGKQVIAERIKALAREHNVPVVEDKPLARAMYDKCEIGMPIPTDFFAAVAEIMAYVYRLKNRRAA